MAMYKSTEEIQLREVHSESRVYIPETQKVPEQKRNKWKVMERDGIAKKYTRVSENESEKSVQSDGRKQL